MLYYNWQWVSNCLQYASDNMQCVSKNLRCVSKNIQRVFNNLRWVSYNFCFWIELNWQGTKGTSGIGTLDPLDGLPVPVWHPLPMGTPLNIPCCSFYFEHLKKTTITSSLSEIVVCDLLTPYFQLLFYTLFQNFDYFLSKSTNLWTQLDFFWQFLRGPNEFVKLFWGILLMKKSHKNHEKAKIWGCWKKCLLCFIYFLLINSIIWSILCIIL